MDFCWLGGQAHCQVPSGLWVHSLPNQLLKHHLTISQRSTGERMQVFVALTFHRVKYNGRVPVALWVLEPSQRLTAAEGQSFDRQEQVSLTVQNTVNSNPSRLFNCHFLSQAEGQNFDERLWRCDGSEGWSICHVYQALRAQLGK